MIGRSRFPTNSFPTSDVPNLLLKSFDLVVFSLYGLAEIEPHFGFEILLVDCFVGVLDKDGRSDCVARCRVYGGKLNVDILPVLECLLGAYRASAVVVDDELSPRKVRTGSKSKEG